MTTPTSTIPGTGTAAGTPAGTPGQPGALSVAITSATPGKVDGSVTNASLPPALNVKPLSMKIDLLGQDGSTVLGTVSPDGATATTAAGGTQPFSITPAAALTAGQAVSAKATQTYPDPANAANTLTRVGTSSPVQVTATPTPPTGQTGPAVGPPTITIQINSAGNSVSVKFGGFPANSAVQSSLTLPGGQSAGPSLAAGANGAGSGNVPINPALRVGQAVRVTLTGSNGSSVGASQTSDGR